MRDEMLGEYRDVTQGAFDPVVAYTLQALGLLQFVSSRLALDTAHYHPPAYIYPSII